MQEVTLRELCVSLGVSRRTIQGYERAGLVKATGKNKMGHLLYDACSQERIRKIRMFQNMGFTIREIKEIIDIPVEEVLPALFKQDEKLKKEKAWIEEQIAIVHDLIQQVK